MKEEECVQEKYHLVVNLVSQLREMQERLNELEKMKVQYEIEMSQRILIEENFHKIRSSLEEQLAERGAEIDRITSERQRIEEESHKIRTSLEEQLAERGAEMDRITAERQHLLQEWSQMLDNLRDRLTNSKF